MRIDKIFGFGALMIAPALGNAQASDEHPTYANEVSRIIQDNCQICHQPGAIGPMSFTSYEEVRPWAPKPNILSILMVGSSTSLSLIHI